MSRLEELFSSFSGADCAIITSDINRRYFTGLKSSAGVIAAFPDKAYLLVDFRYIEMARATVRDAEVIMLTKLIPQLKEKFDRHGTKYIAIEADSMTVSELDSYSHAFLGMNINSSRELSNAIAAMRSVKDES